MGSIAIAGYKPGPGALIELVHNYLPRPRAEDLATDCTLIAIRKADGSTP
jgi:hypothetical protein